MRKGAEVKVEVADGEQKRVDEEVEQRERVEEKVRLLEIEMAEEMEREKERARYISDEIQAERASRLDVMRELEEEMQRRAELEAVLERGAQHGVELSDTVGCKSRRRSLPTGKSLLPEDHDDEFRLELFLVACLADAVVELEGLRKVVNKVTTA
ncbi:hypothetical protein BC829DRAFT_403662 [Chytridium lagenaria]|nr:hypothetical protein BC829DRAFT_403662 [Chytridium lagenaria]